MRVLDLNWLTDSCIALKLICTPLASAWKEDAISLEIPRF